EAIIETYADIFPEGNLTYYKEKYKNEALEKYEQIKTENADKTNPEKAVKCDKIVKAYFSQIKLRESKIILYDKIIDKYNTLKNKINETEEIKQAKNKIHKHEERIKKLDGEKADTEYENALTDTLKLEELEREFQLKTEYTKQLSALQKKYKDEKNVEDYTTSLAFKEEIDKMIDELEQQT
ncbi:MAG: hypothetical protein GXO50_09390, partial [Chlorobi bacterium]|nr:hypothetical protein [Chlorobiota bacterium]